jgi:hypothetical protein
VDVRRRIVECRDSRFRLLRNEAGSVRRGEHDSRVREAKPIWTSASFLVYTGGLTVLGGGLAALGYLSAHYGSGAQAGWALLVYVVLFGLAYAFRGRKRTIAAGIFAFASVVSWGVLVALLFRWWGWLGAHESFKHWSWARLGLELLVLFAAGDARRRFRFPFIRLISAVVGWFFLIDLITAGGNFTAAVTLVVGLAYLLAGWIGSSPSKFWLHLVGGLLIGGAVLYWWHTSDGDWAGVSVVALLFVMLAYLTKRSSWAVLGTIGFFGATVHYIVGSPTSLVGNLVAGNSSGISGWSPALAFGLLGFWLVLLGFMGRRRPDAVPPAE